MATKPQFTGAIRPRLALEHITIDPQVVADAAGRRARPGRVDAQPQLAAGWERYFVWETLIAVGFAVIPLVAVAAVRRRPALWKMLAAAWRWSALVNVGGIALTAASTPEGAAERPDAGRPGRRGPAGRARCRLAGRSPAFRRW